MSESERASERERERERGAREESARRTREAERERESWADTVVQGKSRLLADRIDILQLHTS